MTGVPISKLSSWLLAAALLPALVVSQSLFAQDRCASQELLQNVPAAQRAWMPGGKLFEQNLRREANRTADDDTSVYKVPVVVHIIHRGERLGDSTNILDSRVESQIRILNEDFRRKPNTNGFNTHAAGADTKIEFVLATCDSNGNPHPGINRVRGAMRTWGTGNDRELKRTIMWPKDRYVNIWVCDVESGILGYSTFPVVSGIPMGHADYMDGVVIDYAAFGQTSAGNYNLGRTATHELGHYLGLMHVWGDASGCVGDDYCNDTPIQEGQITGCPTTTLTACPGQPLPMIENYLQYTYDRCMRVFTNDQTYRMRYVLRNSPPRRMLRDSMEVCATPNKPIDKPTVEATFDPVSRIYTIKDQSVDTTSPAIMSLYSVEGKLIWVSSSYSRTLKVQTGSLAKSLYLLRFERGSLRETIKIRAF